MKAVLYLILLLGLVTPAFAGKEFEAAKLLCREGKGAEALKAAKAAFEAAPADPYVGRLYQDLLREKGGRIFEWGVPEGMPAGVKQLLEARALPPEKAVDALKTLVGSKDAPVPARLDLAAALLAVGKPRSAEPIAKEYVEAAPSDPEGHTVLSRVRRAAGNDHAAIAAAERAVALEPALPPATVLLAELHRDTGKDEKSRALLLDALKTYPKNAVLIAGLGEDQAFAGEFEAAASSFELAAERKPDVVEYVLRQAEVLVSGGKYEKALGVASQAVEKSPKSDRARSTLGFVKEKLKDFEGALLSYLEAAKLAPDDLGHSVDAAFMYVVLGDLENAETVLKKVLKTNPKHFEGNLTLGNVYYHLEKYRDAKKYLGAALKADKKSIDANLAMGYVYLAEGKARDAIQYFEKVAKLDEFDPEPVRMIGRAHLSLGKVGDAIESFSGAIDRDPKDPWSHFDMGKALEEKGEFDRAKDSYTKAIELDDSLAHPHLYLAGILDDIDDEPEEALGHYQAYLDLGGEDPQDFVKERIKQLSK